MTSDTDFQANPFVLLGATIRDDSRKLVAMAEERSLHLDPQLCQQARSDLTNPRARLAAELAWMPGVAPRVAAGLVATLAQDPAAARAQDGLPELARANLMAAALAFVPEDEPVATVAELIRDLALVTEFIDSPAVQRDINEDRAVAGFPEVKSIDAIEAGLAERRKAYRSAVKSLLNRMPADRLITAMTRAVVLATDDGAQHGPQLIHDVTDAYELETQGFLHKERDNILALVTRVQSAAPSGEAAVAPLLDQLATVARNWDRVAQPIQISAMARGTTHELSSEVAYTMRSLAIELHNEHGMLRPTQRITELLQELFAELPEVAERLAEDAGAIEDLAKQRREEEESEAQWAREITFHAKIGVLFKDELSISPDGIGWKGKLYPLDSISRVRWGGVRKSINGIPTGTDYTIGFADGSAEVTIQLGKESIYSGFLAALWRGVCVRLLVEMCSALAEGRALTFGDIGVEDGVVTLTKRKFLRANERVRLGWHDVKIWSDDGLFFIGATQDKKIYASSSYLSEWNTHILEHVIRGAFKKGATKLSQYLTG